MLPPFGTWYNVVNREWAVPRLYLAAAQAVVGWQVFPAEALLLLVAPWLSVVL